MRLTISKYYRLCKSISEVGVTPDIVVEEIGMILRLILIKTIN